MMEQITNYIDIFYMLAVVLATWNTITFIKKTTSNQRKFITLAWGILLGAVWFLWLDCEWPKIIIGFLSALGFYEVIAKWINLKINDTYNNGKGI